MKEYIKVYGHPYQKIIDIPAKIHNEVTLEYSLEIHYRFYDYFNSNLLITFLRIKAGYYDNEI